MFPEYSVILLGFILLIFYIHILAGGSGLPKVSPSKTDVSSNISISHAVVDSDGSDR